MCSGYVYILAMNAEKITADEELERRIHDATRSFCDAQTPEDRRAAWEQMKALIAQRSPEQIARMEAKFL
jgi:cobalamin biosynthesis protein CbiD